MTYYSCNCEKLTGHKQVSISSFRFELSDVELELAGLFLYWSWHLIFFFALFFFSPSTPTGKHSLKWLPQTIKCIIKRKSIWSSESLTEKSNAVFNLNTDFHTILWYSRHSSITKYYLLCARTHILWVFRL